MRLVTSYAISLALSLSNQVSLPVNFLPTLSLSSIILSSDEVQTQTQKQVLSPQMLYTKGIVELSSGDFQTALEDFTTAIEIAEKTSVGADRMSDLHVSRGTYINMIV